MTITVNGIEELKGLVGQTIGPSDWREVTQDEIDQFADIAQDHQWIHVDVERAKTESPYGTTVAHGNLTLSMIDGFRPSLMESSGFKMGVNYGWNKVRFPAPVPSASRIRASTEVLSVDEVGGGWHQIVQKWTVEVEGSEKPACVAESVGRVLAQESVGRVLAQESVGRVLAQESVGRVLAQESVGRVLAEESVRRVPAQ